MNSTVQINKRNRIGDTVGDRVFKVVTFVLVMLMVFTCLFPFLNIVSVSLSSKNAVLSGTVGLWPVNFNTLAYKTVFENKPLIDSLYFTIFITALYVAVTMIMTVLCAYPLSRKNLKGRTAYLLFIMFTMYFSGGMIPAYLNISSLGLMDNMWSLILPGAISTYNMILMKTYFSALPPALEESAKIDGANEMVILVRVVLPLSKAMLATIALFYAVSRWNSFTDSVLYINDPRMYTLQLRLRQIISLNVSDGFMDTDEAKAQMVFENIKSACLVFSMVPILILYPWLQKYFVKGVMIGSIKG